MVELHLRFTQLLRLRGRLREPFLALQSQYLDQSEVWMCPLSTVQPITQRLVNIIAIFEKIASVIRPLGHIYSHLRFIMRELLRELFTK